MSSARCLLTHPGPSPPHIYTYRYKDRISFGTSLRGSFRKPVCTRMYSDTYRMHMHLYRHALLPCQLSEQSIRPSLSAGHAHAWSFFRYPVVALLSCRCVACGRAGAPHGTDRRTDAKSDRTDGGRECRVCHRTPIAQNTRIMAAEPPPGFYYVDAGLFFCIPIKSFKFTRTLNNDSCKKTFGLFMISK